MVDTTHRNRSTTWEPGPITGRKEQAMTRKELREVQESYRDLAKSCLESEYRYAEITGICRRLATEMCYNHHERGQRLWAFFQALAEEEHR